jgi:hypothetical protein
MLLVAGTNLLHAQGSSSVNYLASHCAYATVDDKGEMGAFSEWVENEATIKYFKAISMFIVIPENEEKGTGYFIRTDGVTESTNETGDTEILYKCMDAKNNPANILISKSKAQETQTVIYLFKENECFAYFISLVENPDTSENN